MQIKNRIITRHSFGSIGTSSYTSNHFVLTFHKPIFCIFWIYFLYIFRVTLVYLIACLFYAPIIFKQNNSIFPYFCIFGPTLNGLRRFACVLFVEMELYVFSRLAMQQDQPVSVKSLVIILVNDWNLKYEIVPNSEQYI